jgi:hypothetical protein
LDHFLISEEFLEEALRIFQWVSSGGGGDLDHCHMLWEMALAQGKLASPFKLYTKWLKEEDFIKNDKSNLGTI